MLLQLVNQLRVAKEIFISIFKKKSLFFCCFTCWFVDDGSKLWAKAVNIELTTSDGFCDVVDVFFDSYIEERNVEEFNRFSC